MTNLLDITQESFISTKPTNKYLSLFVWLSAVQPANLAKLADAHLTLLLLLFKDSNKHFRTVTD